MSTRNDGGPAFPGGLVDVAQKVDADPSQSGMSLRDWFAGQALVGAGTWAPFLVDDKNFAISSLTDDLVQGARAKWAYQQADAMLKARGGR